jgi:hypothetical protein
MQCQKVAPLAKTNGQGSCHLLPIKATGGKTTDIWKITYEFKNSLHLIRMMV